MNKILFKKELKEYLLSTIIWTIAVCILITIIILLYPKVKSIYAQLESMLSTLPPEMVEKMQSSGMLTIKNIMEYYLNNSFATLTLIGIVFSSILSIQLMKSDYQRKNNEYLYSLPISSKKILNTKFVVYLIYTLLFNVVIMSVVLMLFAAMGESGFSLEPFFARHLTLLLCQLVFGICYISINAMSKKGINLASSLGIIFLSMFISTISMISNETKFLKYFTPMTVLQGGSPATFASLEFVSIGIWVAISVVLYIVANQRILKRDII